MASAFTTLIEGNIKSRHNPSNYSVDGFARKRQQLAAGQAPHTIVVACADSRVPVERIFDADLGDLFVVRVAGNVIDDVQLASIEFAADVLKAPRLLVLGHTCCGAVAAAVEHVHTGAEMPTPSLQYLVKLIEPAVAKSARDRDEPKSSVVERSVVHNARYQLDSVLKRSNVIKSAVDRGTLTVAAAVYDIATGDVRFV